VRNVEAFHLIRPMKVGKVARFTAIAALMGLLFCCLELKFVDSVAGVMAFCL
jgi:hypothetical protein